MIVRIILILFNGDSLLWLYFALSCLELLLFTVEPGPWVERVSNLTIGWLSPFGLSSLYSALSLSSHLAPFSYYFKYQSLFLVSSEYGFAPMKLCFYSNFKYSNLGFKSSNSSQSESWISSVSLLESASLWVMPFRTETGSSTILYASA